MIEYFLAAIVLLFLFMWYMGLFHKLEISEGSFHGGFYIYYDYQGHINNATRFQETLKIEIKDVDFSKMRPLTITYDDPFNLKDARAYRATLGFLV